MKFELLYMRLLLLLLSFFFCSGTVAILEKKIVSSVHSQNQLLLKSKMHHFLLGRGVFLGTGFGIVNMKAFMNFNHY